MARTLRTKSETGIYHVMMRGVKILRSAKEFGASIRQLERMTGIGFSIVKRA